MQATAQLHPQTPQEKVNAIQSLLKTLGIEIKLLYTKSEAVRIIGLSAPTLDRMKAAGVGMEHKKVQTGNGKNGRVMYPIGEIARFYFDTVKTA